MDFGSLDSIIQEEDLADADKKKIIASKKWQEHVKDHPDAQLIRVEHEEILTSQKLPPPEVLARQQPKAQSDWLKEDEKKPIQEVQQQFQDQHMAQHAAGAAWECNCGKAMESPKKKDDSTAYKLQKDEEDDTSSAYLGGASPQELYGNAPPEGGGPGGAYLGGGNMEDRQDQLYNRG